jgi:arsenate reductase (thioredoxin)
MKNLIKPIKALAVLSTLTVLFSFTYYSNLKADFYKKLKNYCNTLPNEFNQISDERKKDLREIGDFIIEKRMSHKLTNLLFVCTSNSRRSHMAQVWSQTAALYYGIDSVWTFSGGTEATKVNPNAVYALRRCGFSVTTSQGTENPVWLVAQGNKTAGFAIFSKKYDNSINPKKEFCAIMVCSGADKSCPVVDGAELRILMPYEDPKYYDNTPSQELKYDERCREIARDVFFMMDYVKKAMILKSEIKR